MRVLPALWSNTRRVCPVVCGRVDRVDRVDRIAACRAESVHRARGSLHAPEQHRAQKREEQQGGCRMAGTSDGVSHDRMVRETTGPG